MYNNRGDFNIRMGEEGGLEELGEMNRKSKDKTVENEGRRLVNMIEEIEEYIMNGSVKGDKKGEFTYIGAKGCTVIDYNIVNEACNNKVKSFRIKNRIESDHLPIVLTIRDGEKEEGRGKEEE